MKARHLATTALAAALMAWGTWAILTGERPQKREEDPNSLSRQSVEVAHDHSKHSAWVEPQTASASFTTHAPPLAHSVNGDSSTSASAQRAPLSREDFIQLTERVLRTLPTRAELNKLNDEEVHGTPAPIEAAGALLAQVAQAVADQPELEPEAARFYSRCASSKQLLTPARALCYSHVAGTPEAPQENEIPEDVKQLAQMVGST